tara:strand:- start:597 stop:704 length:108 start_codon:yes stop_codon:yes gene_type:complete
MSSEEDEELTELPPLLELLNIKLESLLNIRLDSLL